MTLTTNAVGGAMFIKMQHERPFMHDLEDRDTEYFSHSGRSVAVDSTDTPPGAGRAAGADLTCGRG